MNSIASTLQINDLQLTVYIGWPAEERQQLQKVSIDIEIRFLELPKACASDQLNETICYSNLIGQIKQTFNHHRFHLIEHLTHKIYFFIKSQLANNAHIFVHTTKHPKIEGLSGGVRFSCGDVTP